MNDDPNSAAVVNEEKANAPPRAIDVYVIASRLKRMISASTAAQLASSAGDVPGRDLQLSEFFELSKGLEPLLDGLVYSGTAEND